jgi:hypothetical protein
MVNFRMQQPRFVTNREGQKVVELDVKTYEQLVRSASDPLLLRDVTLEQLEALAEGKLSTASQAELSSLIQKEKAGGATPEEIAMLDKLMKQLDQLDMLKARAIYTLQKAHGLEYNPKELGHE